MVCHALSYCVYGNIWHTMVYQCVHETENVSDEKKKILIKIMLACVMPGYVPHNPALHTLTRQQQQNVERLREQLGP